MITFGAPVLCDEDCHAYESTCVLLGLGAPVQAPAATMRNSEANAYNRAALPTLEHPYLSLLWMRCEPSSDLTARCRARCERPWLFIKQSRLQAMSIRFKQIC